MVKKPNRHGAGIEAAPRRHKDIIDREIVRDRRLSLRALGAAVRLLSNAPGFRMTSIDLARERKEGRDAVRAALRELKTIGYLQQFVEQLESGQWVTRQIINDTLPPGPENPSSVPTPEKPTSGTPNVGARGIKSRESNTSNLTNSEITTTTPSSLCWPRGLDMAQAVVVARTVEGLEQQAQQQLLDELAGALSGSTPPRKLVSWMRALRARMESGEFVPDAGLSVAAERARRQVEEEERRQKAEEKRIEEERRSTPEAKALSEAVRKKALQEIGKIFHHKPEKK